MAIVKMRVLHGTRAQHKTVSAGTPEGVVPWLETAFYDPKRCILNHLTINIINELPTTGGIRDSNHFSQMVVGKSNPEYYHYE